MFLYRVGDIGGVQDGSSSKIIDGIDDENVAAACRAQLKVTISYHFLNMWIVLFKILLISIIAMLKYFFNCIK